MRALVRPVSEGFFAGALDFRNVPLAFNTLLLAVWCASSRAAITRWDAIAIRDLAATLQRGSVRPDPVRSHAKDFEIRIAECRWKELFPTWRGN